MCFLSMWSILNLSVTFYKEIDYQLFDLMWKLYTVIQGDKFRKNDLMKKETENVYFYSKNCSSPLSWSNTHGFSYVIQHLCIFILHIYLLCIYVYVLTCTIYTHHSSVLKKKVLNWLIFQRRNTLSVNCWITKDKLPL